MMKNIVSKSLLMTGMASMIIAGATAQTNSNLIGQINTITTAVPFLLICPDSRAGGMGETGVASSPDVSSIHWNTAKLAFSNKNFGIGLSYSPWLRQLVDDINLAYLSFYKKVKDNQAFGGSLRYFSLGNITFTDNVGNVTGQFNPNEFAIDMAYSRKLGEEISGGIALRYINSNLTGGYEVGGARTKAGQSIAADISAYWTHDLEVADKESNIAVGLAITNIGSKISYSETGTKDFIPTNLRLGSCFKMNLNDYNEVSFNVDFNKLLVPTPPAYERDSATGELIIVAGKFPDVSVAKGMFQSFSDAPGGWKEEMQEIIWQLGFEYWYDKQFSFRAGYFHEAPTKGNRQFFTLGAGLRYNVFGLDFAYLIPTEQRNPLENTLRFTLSFEFDKNTGDKKESTTE